MYDTHPTIKSLHFRSRRVRFTFVNGVSFQNGDRCYCGNDYGRHGAADTCDTECSGDVEGDVCGGILATSVWKVASGD